MEFEPKSTTEKIKITTVSATSTCHSLMSSPTRPLTDVETLFLNREVVVTCYSNLLNMVYGADLQKRYAHIHKQSGKKKKRLPQTTLDRSFALDQLCTMIKLHLQATQGFSFATLRLKDVNLFRRPELAMELEPVRWLICTTLKLKNPSAC